MNDVVMMKELNAIRSHWQLGQVTKVFPSKDALVRHIEIRYKIPANKKCSFVKRAVQSVIILLPAVDDASH